MSDLQIWLPLMALTLCWHRADFNCLFSWPWWRHSERSDPRNTKSEIKIPSTLRTPFLRCGLLRTLSVLTFWSTIEILPFHVRSAMPQSVNCCMSSAIVLLLILGIWMILIIIDTIFSINYDIVGNVARQMWRHLNVATFAKIDVCGRRKASSWH